MSKHVSTDLSARTKLLSYIVKGQADATFRFATYTDGKPNPDEALGSELPDAVGDREATINALADGKQLSAFALAGPEGAVSGALGQLAPFCRFDHGGAHWAVIPVSDADSSLVDVLLGALPNDVDATEFIPLPSTGVAIEFGPDVALSSREVMEALGLRGLSAESAGGVWNLNDAEVHGEISNEILNTPVRIALGNSQEEKKWKVSEEAPFGLLLDPFLTTHKVGKKNGPCFVTGALVDTDRRKNAVTSLHMIGLDVDSGASLDKTFAQIKSMGLFVVAYTTHSHRTTEIRIKQDRYWKWCEKTGNDGNVPTTETVREFLKTETQYVNDVIESARYVEIVHDREGMNLAIETLPIHKFRLIFLLEEPYVIAEQKMAQRDAILQWERMVMGLGQMLGIEVDRAARDPSRLFFYPRHPKGATNFKILVNGSGRKLDWREIKQAEPHTIGKRRASDDPFENAAEAMGDGNERIITKDGFDLSKWVARRGDGFMISELLKDHADDRLRAEIQPGKFVCECPFDEEHSNSGDLDDKGCYIEDAGGSVEQFQFRCSHNSCSGRDRLAMLCKAIDDGWFDGEVLYDPRYDCVDRGNVADESRSDGQPDNQRSTHFKNMKAAFAAMNREIAFVERGSDVVIYQKRESGDGWKRISAARDIYRPWTAGKGDDEVFPAWLKSPERDHRTDIVFEPYRYDAPDPTPPHLLNMYRGFAIAPKAGDAMDYYRHVFHVVCGGNVRLFAWLMDWCADMVQNPAEKPGTAPVLHGLKGTGKGLFVQPLQQIWGLRHAVKVNNLKQLTGNFNGHMDAKILAVAEESFWGGDKQADSVIKDMITSGTMMLERKFMDPIEVRDCRRFIFLSNAENVIRATPDERRYAVTMVSPDRIGDR
ncbi:MAG: hypothetical protein KDK08_22555, partial [Rhizobiaceae bacterium]|nr:hypothetical protein [Rhizobiaceae bacterium]